MHNAILFDRTRINWTRDDWKRYATEDKEYGEKLLATLLDGNFSEVNQLIEKGLGYYHFPDNTYALLSLQERKPQMFYFLMSKKKEFYQYAA